MSHVLWLRALVSSVFFALVVSPLAVPSLAIANSENPENPEEVAEQGVWFTTPGGIDYYSAAIYGHYESGRISVSVPRQGLVNTKGLRVVVTDAIYGRQSLRINPTPSKFGLATPRFCGVPPHYRGSWDVPPGYQPQEVTVSWPEADGSWYSQRYEVDWYDIRTIPTWRKEKFRIVYGNIRVLWSNLREARQQQQYNRAVRILKRIKITKTRLQAVKPYYSTCSDGPYTAS